MFIESLNHCLVLSKLVGNLDFWNSLFPVAFSRFALFSWSAWEKSTTASIQSPKPAPTIQLQVLLLGRDLHLDLMAQDQGLSSVGLSPTSDANHRHPN